mmetsp:Transcript_8506/g.16035  ORF Transcript_8506/g.16035 Transcript_8506/m.16035 type:complete len:343 (-) Transcript_8506:91-1119(-)
MGNKASHEFDGCTTLGYRVLGVQPNSPASRAGLVSFFDFLVGVNGQLLFDNGEHSDPAGEYFEDLDFISIVKDNVDKEIELLVWNIKNKTQRFITLTPSTNWNGTGLLGVTIRIDDYVTAEENLLRVVSIQSGSPAAKAGLKPETDYLLGTTMESFENEDVLGDVLYENENHVLEIYVYNSETDVVRVVTIVPSLKWGGGGLLGAEVGRGYLHGLPKSCRNTLGISFERKISISVDDHLLQVVSAETKVAESSNVLVDTSGSLDQKQDEVLHTTNESRQSTPEIQNDDTTNDLVIEQELEGNELVTGIERSSSSNYIVDDLPPPPFAIIDDDGESGGHVDLK